MSSSSFPLLHICMHANRKSITFVMLIRPSASPHVRSVQPSNRLGFNLEGSFLSISERCSSDIPKFPSLPGYECSFCLRFTIFCGTISSQKCIMHFICSPVIITRGVTMMRPWKSLGHLFCTPISLGFSRVSSCQ